MIMHAMRWLQTRGFKRQIHDYSKDLLHTLYNVQNIGNLGEVINKER